MTKPNYNQDMQKLYLEMFLGDAETFIRCQNIFEPENFDRKFKSKTAGGGHILNMAASRNAAVKEKKAHT